MRGMLRPGNIWFSRNRELCISKMTLRLGLTRPSTAVRWERRRIGQGTKIDNLVHIGHNCVIGKNVIIAAQTGISGSSVVEDGAILGGQVGIGEHATVGAGVILGGGAGVLSGKKMRGPGQVFWGRPARPLKEYLRDLARLRKG